MKKILSVRKKIDDLDLQIFKILEKRYKLINEISKFKLINTLPIKQKNREKLQLDKLNKLYHKEPKSYRFIRNIFKFILKESKKTQKTLFQ